MYTVRTYLHLVSSLYISCIHLAVQGMHLSEDGYVDKCVFIGGRPQWISSQRSKYGRRQKSSHLPFVQWDGQYCAVPVLFPFYFRAVAVLVRLQTIPVLSQEQPVRSSEWPGR